MYNHDEGFSGAALFLLICMEAVNIGRRIEEELRRDGHSIAWFARMLCCNRQNVYNIFKRESIDTHLLNRICKILNHDFFKDYSEALDSEEV